MWLAELGRNISQRGVLWRRSSDVSRRRASAHGIGGCGRGYADRGKRSSSSRTEEELSLLGQQRPLA